MSYLNPAESEWRVVNALQKELDELENRIKEETLSGIIADVLEDFELTVDRQKKDPISDRLAFQVQRIALHIESLIGNAPNQEPTMKRWLWGSMRLFRQATHPTQAISNEIRRAHDLLETTVARRRPFASVYSLSFCSRLAGSPSDSVYLYRTLDGIFLPLELSDTLRLEHRELEAWSSFVVTICEEVQPLLEVIPAESAKLVDHLLRIFSLALRISFEMPYFQSNERLQVFKNAKRICQYFDLRVLISTGMLPWKRITKSQIDDMLRRLKSIEKNLEDFYKDRRRTLEANELEPYRSITLEVITEREQDLLAWGKVERRVFSHQNYAKQTDNAESQFTLSGLGVNMLPQELVQHSQILHDIPGGFSVVYFVELNEPLMLDKDSTFDEGYREIHKVAVKVIHTTPVSTGTKHLSPFAHEIRVWSKLKHINILPFLGLWQKFRHGSSLTPYGLVSPWMEDGHVLHYVQTKPQTSVQQRIRFLSDIASALTYLHRHDFRIVHGDVKADNALVHNNRAYLSDFGISSMLHDIDHHSSITAGNWRYRAPELLHTDGTSPSTPETDVYSFGHLILEVLTGRISWDRRRKEDVERERMRAPWTIPSRPRLAIKEDSVWFLIISCWKESPTLRPTSMEIRKRLEEIVEAYPQTFQARVQIY